MGASNIWRSDCGRKHPERVTARQRKILEIYMYYESYDMAAYSLGLSRNNVKHSLERTRAHMKARTNKQAYHELYQRQLAMAG